MLQRRKLFPLQPTTFYWKPILEQKMQTQLVEITRKNYTAKYSVEFFERKKIPSYALWAVSVKNEKGIYPKVPTAYGKTDSLEQANIELSNWCISHDITLEMIRNDMHPWRLVKDLIDGKSGAEFFARGIAKRVTKNQVIEVNAPQNELVHLVNGKPYCDSLTVADKFKKPHKNVLRAYDNLPKDNFWRLNFEPRDYIDDRGKTQRKIEMTWKGFSMLAMGFTGQSAYEWKQGFLDAFEYMGDYIFRHKQEYEGTQRIAVLEDKRHVHNPMMDALIEFRAEHGKETKPVHYMSENKLCNGVVTGNYSRAYEATMTNEQVVLLAVVRRRNESYLMAGIDYNERKKRLVAFATKHRTNKLIGQSK